MLSLGSVGGGGGAGGGSYVLKRTAKRIKSKDKRVDESTKCTVTSGC